MCLNKKLAAMTIVLSGSCAMLMLQSSSARPHAGAPSTAPSAGPSAAPSTQPINKFCAVERDDPIDPAVTVVYQGKTIGFCCKDCPPKFKANPEKYMKDLK